MRVGLVLAALFCFTSWMTVGNATHGPVADCPCVAVSNTRVSLERIVSYTIQRDGICPVAAIAFRTKLSKTICSDPNTVWARRAKAKVDMAQKTPPQDKPRTVSTTLKMEVTTSNITPTMPTTMKDEEEKKTTLQEIVQTEDVITSDITPAPAVPTTFKVDEEGKKKTSPGKGQNEDLTSDITPAVSTTMKDDEEGKKTTLQEMGPTEDLTTSDITPAPAVPTTFKVDEEGKKKTSPEKGQNEDLTTSDITPAPAVPTTFKVDEEGKKKTSPGKGQTEDLTSDITPTVSTTMKDDEEGEKKNLQKTGQTEDVATSDIKPAASTTPKKIRRKKGKCGGRRHRRKCGRGKRLLRKHQRTHKTMQS